MHLEKRKVGKVIKYFLAYSYREGKKVHKFRKYLGQDLKGAVAQRKKNNSRKAHSGGNPQVQNNQILSSSAAFRK